MKIVLFFSLRANLRGNLRGPTPALRGARRHDLMDLGLSYAEVLRLSSAVLRPSAPGGANFIKICEERLLGSYAETYADLRGARTTIFRRFYLN